MNHSLDNLQHPSHFSLVHFDKFMFEFMIKMWLDTGWFWYWFIGPQLTIQINVENVILWFQVWFQHMLSSHSPLLHCFLKLMQLELINRERNWDAVLAVTYLQTWQTCRDQRTQSSHLSSRQFQFRFPFPRYLAAK